MEQQSQQIWIRIQCPKCETRYRIDRSKIPASGVTIQCKKCRQKLVLRRKSSALPAVNTAPPSDKCPKCGFDQKQGEFCYKCGARIRYIEKQPATGSQKTEIPVGLLEIDLQPGKTSFYLSVTKPVIEIDKEPYIRSWGPQQFQLPPGRYHLKFYVMLFGRRFCEKFLIIEIEKDQYVKLQYEAAVMDQSKVEVLRKETDATWRALITRKKKEPIKSPFYLKPWPVIFMLATSYPVGVYLLLKSKHISDSNKWILGIVFLIVFIYLLSKFKLPSF